MLACHPETLVENIIRHFIETKLTENVCSKQGVSDERDAPVPKLSHLSKTTNHQLSDLSNLELVPRVLSYSPHGRMVYTMQTCQLQESTLTSKCQGGTPASRIHNHNTRFVSNLSYFRPRVSTNLGKTSFKFSAPKVWETVPLGLKCLPYHKFKKEWKSCLLTNQI